MTHSLNAAQRATDDTDDSARQQGQTIAIVLCAGQGTRMAASENKVFLALGGQPLLTYALRAFEECPEIDGILLVAHPAEIRRCEQIVAEAGIRKVLTVLAGGASRHQSESHALERLRPRIGAGEVAQVVIHDGARPFVSQDALHRLLAAARASGAAMLATPCAADGVLLRVAPTGDAKALVPTAALVRAQTPQAFDACDLLAAYDAAAQIGFEGTDTASSLERLGHRVRIVLDAERNLKVTTPDDLVRAEFLLHMAPATETAPATERGTGD